MRAANLWIFGAFALAAAGTSAHAQSAQATMNPRVTIIPSCTLVATDLDFGSPAPGTTTIDATSELTIRCTTTTTFSILMDRGDNSAGQQRRMRGTTGDYVEYSIFRNSNRTQDWGATNQTGRPGVAVALTPANYTVYGRIPVLDVATLQGSYLDTITVTIDF